MSTATRSRVSQPIPWFGARAFARALQTELAASRAEAEKYRLDLQRLGAFTVVQLEAERDRLKADIHNHFLRFEEERATATADLAATKAKALAELEAIRAEHAAARARVVETEDIALLQQAGIYHYRHPLADAVRIATRLLASSPE